MTDEICGFCGGISVAGAVYCAKCGKGLDRNMLPGADQEMDSRESAERKRCIVPVKRTSEAKPEDLVPFADKPPKTLRRICDTIKAAKMIEAESDVLGSWVRNRGNSKGIVVEMEVVDAGIIFDRKVKSSAKIHTY